MFQPLPAGAMTLRFRRRIFALTVVLSVLGTAAFWKVLGDDGQVGWLEWTALPLFVLLFGWIAFSFSMAVEGFVAELRRTIARHGAAGPSRVPPTEGSRTAVLVPVYNESPERVMAAVAAMREQLTSEIQKPENVGLRFDFFVLSDSTDPEVWLREEWCWSAMAEPAGAALQEREGLDDADGGVDSIAVFYRHRSDNRARKAGNLADFCEKWGAHYDHMIVLDADSLMTGGTMVEMTRRMNADPEMGILQVPPVPIGRRSLFARLQQFSAAIYGPVFACGYSRFSGVHGNYWGHNAILRMRPFMRHCHLPVLKGAAPLGGEILSHDFVEAALMVRNGWKVVLATDLAGSFEECPTTLLDYAKRDHRWCQGNLQHIKLLVAENIHPISRLHFFSGILAYASSPLWMLFMFLTMASLVGTGGGDVDPLVAPERVPVAFGLFATSMLLLLLPKAFAVVTTVVDPAKRRSLGGAGRVVLSAVVETLFSVLIAPIVAIYHSRFVLSVLLGHNVRWNAQQRDEHGVGWRDAFGQMKWMTVGGLSLTIGLWSIDPALTLWFSPLLLGWCLSIPIAVAMGSRRLGVAFQRAGLLQIQQERHAEPIVSRHAHWIAIAEATVREIENEPVMTRLVRDAQFRARHLAILRAAGNCLPVTEHEPEWLDRQKPIDQLATISPKSLRRLLCDDSWVEGLS